MKLSAPTQPLFLISVILGVLSLAGHFASIPFVSLNQYWFAIAAYAVLAVGCLFNKA